MSREEDDGFLGRWSRLKRVQAKAAPDPEPRQEALPEPETEAEAEPEALSEEDLAALPRVEDLIEGSDIRPFLRIGVPRGLRNAALRRMWMLTPGIRDYRDPAVDYAWDWNTPGGVPGDGIAPSPERAAEMLRDLLAPRPKSVPERPAEDAPAEEDAKAIQSAEVATDPNVEIPADADAAPDPERESEPLPRRRHGSALPG